MWKLYVRLYYFYNVFLFDLLVDILVATFIILFAYYVVVPSFSLSYLAATFIPAGFYEVAIWPLPFFYCIDWHYRLFLQSFFDAADMQYQVLGVSRW
jgi:hypothetical protein